MNCELCLDEKPLLPLICAHRICDECDAEMRKSTGVPAEKPCVLLCSGKPIIYENESYLAAVARTKNKLALLKKENAKKELAIREEHLKSLDSKVYDQIHSSLVSPYVVNKDYVFISKHQGRSRYARLSVRIIVDDSGYYSGDQYCYRIGDIIVYGDPPDDEDENWEIDHPYHDSTFTFEDFQKLQEDHETGIEVDSRIKKINLVPIKNGLAVMQRGDLLGIIDDDNGLIVGRMSDEIIYDYDKAIYLNCTKKEVRLVSDWRETGQAHLDQIRNEVRAVLESEIATAISNQINFIEEKQLESDIEVLELYCEYERSGLLDLLRPLSRAQSTLTASDDQASRIEKEPMEYYCVAENVRVICMRDHIVVDCGKIIKLFKVSTLEWTLNENVFSSLSTTGWKAFDIETGEDCDPQPDQLYCGVVIPEKGKVAIEKGIWVNGYLYK